MTTYMIVTPGQAWPPGTFVDGDELNLGDELESWVAAGHGAEVLGPGELPTAERIGEPTPPVI